MAAIYQWFTGKSITLTTSLYAAEATDGVELSTSLIYGYMELIPGEEYNIGIESTSGSIATVYFSTGPEDEAYDIAIESTSGSIEAVLISTGPEDEIYDIGIESTDGGIDSKLVYAEMPDEAMNIGISLISGSMDPV